ncbi:MAG: IS256 family transposase [Bacteroidetes bacterium]|jgi:transposase-like protein|nr:IS256 family transposase [Bacteroidota bacterium]
MATFEITIDDNKIQDLLQSDQGLSALLGPILNQVLDAEMTDHLQAAPHEQTDRRQGYRNGSYERQLTTRVGTLDLEVPRDREGTSRPLSSTGTRGRDGRVRLKALVLALMQMVVQGVSTRRVKKITTELCGREFTRSTVSRLCEGLDEQVNAWAQRPLDGQPYPFVLLDAMQVKVRRQGAMRATTVMLGVGIGADGQRELLGLHLAYGETEGGWHRFIERLKARGLSGVRVATSDAHEGLRQALHTAFPGLIWQRCQAHFRRNVIDQTPPPLRDRMHDRLDAILTTSSPTPAREALEATTDALEGEAETALRVLEAGFDDATAVLALPPKYRRRLRTTNMVKRLIEEIRRRERVVRIFPRMEAARRLIGARCAEQHEEGSTGRRYLTMEAFFDWEHAKTHPDRAATALPQAA